MKKCLLSFLLISLTIIGDGYAAENRCQLQEVKSLDVKINQRYELDLKCRTNGTYSSGNSYTARWTYKCEREVGMCKNNDYVLVWGGYKRGDQKDCPGNGKNDGYCTGLTVYRCSDDGLDHWEVYAHDPVRIMRDCSDISDMDKVKTEGDYDIYVKKTYYSSFNKQECSTKAYAVKDFTKDICKMNTDKKCGKSPSAVTANTSAFFCLEEDQVNVYQNKNNRWKKRDDVNVSVCTNSPSGNGWQKVGGYHDLFLFTNNDAWNPWVSFGGVFGEGDTVVQHIQYPNKYCLWCEDINMTPKEKEGGGYECVEEPEETGDDTGGDSSAESQVVEEICGGVQCNSGRNGKSIFCAENKEDTYVYKCDSGHWSEVDVYGYCCNKNCSKPKKPNLVLGGSWTTDTGHEMWFSTTARINEIAWLFNSPDVNNNCTACKEGTGYNKTNKKCE